MAKCETCQKELRTIEIRCTQCGQLKWPYLAEKPTHYVCELCRSGAGEARRAAVTTRKRIKGRLAPQEPAGNGG